MRVTHCPGSPMERLVQLGLELWPLVVSKMRPSVVPRKKVPSGALGQIVVAETPLPA